MNTKVKSILILFISCCFTLTTNAQDETLFDKINLKITGAWGGPHTIFSSFQDDNSFSNGGFGGIELGKTVFVGWGGYSMESNIVLDGAPSQTFKLNYSGPHISYSWKPQKVVHPNISIMAGPGRTFINDVKNDNIFIIQPAIGAEINVFKWFRVNIRGGYRTALDADNSVTNEDISSLFGGIDFKFGWSWGEEVSEGKGL